MLTFMTSFPKSLLLAGLLLAAAPTALAQTGARPKPKSAAPAAKPQAAAPAPKIDEAKIEAQAVSLTQNLKQALGLTPQQEAKVLEINQRCIRQVEVARIQYRADLRKLNSVIDDIGGSRLTLLKDVLSPAQFNKYQQAREKKMGLPSQAASQGNAVPGLPPGRGEE
jgi:predicted metal-dependent phosphoesterase TrpH